MKAVVLESPNVLTYTEVDDPEPIGRRPVRLRIAAVGVCGSDLLRYAHGTAYRYPLVLGHEFSAVVDRAPADSRFRPGDHVAVFPLLPNPEDPYTGIGEWALGADYDYYGSRRDGAMAELMWAPEANLVPVPAEMPLTHAAMIEPASVALHAVRKLTVPTAGTALVVGAGPIGILAAQWLRILGWDSVVVADVDAGKRAVADRLGFPTIDPAEGDTVAAAHELTAGRGVDAAVEASGLALTLEQCLRAAAPQGQVLILGDLKSDITIDRALISSVIRRELTVYGTWNSKITPAGRSEWDTAVAHAADGSLQLEPVISHAVPLAEAPALMRQMADRSVWFNKVLFTVDDRARAVPRRSDTEVSS